MLVPEPTPAPTPPGPARHSFVRVTPHAWTEWLGGDPQRASDPLLPDWAEQGRPLIVRRLLPEEAPSPQTQPLGLALPPTSSPKRIALNLPTDAILSCEAPPRLEDCIDVAPAEWCDTLERIAGLSDDYAIDVRVFGSLAWAKLTGLPYLRAGSDLDLVIACPPGPIRMLLAALKDVVRHAPMRVDAELVLPGGRAAHWQELLGTSTQVLVKGIDGAVFFDRIAFVEGQA